MRHDAWVLVVDAGEPVRFREQVWHGGWCVPDISALSARRTGSEGGERLGGCPVPNISTFSAWGRRWTGSDAGEGRLAVAKSRLAPACPHRRRHLAEVAPPLPGRHL